MCWKREGAFIEKGSDGIWMGVDIMAMMLLVELLGFTCFLLKNIANIVSMEISIAFNFTISRFWTWNDVPKKQGKGLVGQFIAFNLAALTGIGIRALSFPSLELLGVYYILNVIIGICLAATIDFILYDRMTFSRSAHEG